MDEAEEQLHRQLEELRQSYLGKLPAKLAELRATLHEVAQTPVAGSDALKRLHNLAHSLVGSSGTFGLDGLSKNARRVELDIKDYLDHPRDLTPADIERLTTLLDELEQTHQSTGTDAPEASASAAQDDTHRYVKNPLIYLISDDRTLNRDLEPQLAGFGYETRVLDADTDLDAALRQAPPAALVVDLPGREAADAATARILNLRTQAKLQCPVLFVASVDDIRLRLQAVRSGGNAYFTKPLRIAPLVERIDMLTRQTQHIPYRVLIIDDEVELAGHYALVLQGAGMETHTLHHPFDILEVISDFRPDIILMDTHLPECSGEELAQVLRQSDTCIRTPIIFLSTQGGADTLHQAIGPGADGFLIKPIRNADLIQAVSLRAERSRLLDSSMGKDGLTGFLSHSAIKEKIAFELARKERLGSDFSLALIDIDAIAEINATHGHLAGDRVLITLAQLLKQRLRDTDIIGRYGGEEFAVLLPDTPLPDALSVLNEIRDGFAQIIHIHHGIEFKASFSAGLTYSKRYQDPAHLIEAAGMALYQAKEGGRNRIINAG